MGHQRVHLLVPTRSSQVHLEHWKPELVFLLQPAQLVVPPFEQLEVPVLCLGWQGGAVVTFGRGGSCSWLVQRLMGQHLNQGFELGLHSSRSIRATPIPLGHRCDPTGMGRKDPTQFVREETISTSFGEATRQYGG
ncbi:uncharacterized protein LOC133879439 [Alnus glutinosa]|uniref:uncharacterized protein LOC133879439 n=1 Tax=Alnus glutinosa TaxID=3517 RepID=UPI002D78BB68|nr:uncharacterized protein LOC133879439 [Alnus glutinosa]